MSGGDVVTWETYREKMTPLPNMCMESCPLHHGGYDSAGHVFRQWYPGNSVEPSCP